MYENNTSGQYLLLKIEAVNFLKKLFLNMQPIDPRFPGGEDFQK